MSQKDMQMGADCVAFLIERGFKPVSAGHYAGLVLRMMRLASRPSSESKTRAENLARTLSRDLNLPRFRVTKDAPPFVVSPSCDTLRCGDRTFDATPTMFDLDGESEEGVA